MPERVLVSAVETEFRRYKKMAEDALDQVRDDELSVAGPGDGNSLAINCWHVSGNLRSRFTEFLTTDGEKPWRGREEEFARRTVSRAELLEKWNAGWTVLFDTLANLADDQLSATVSIRQQQLPVHEALLRALAHVSYHVGQIVYVAHAFRGAAWRYLSIPPGQSDAYNANPTKERPR